MADTHKSGAEQLARRVAEWLAQNEDRFRQGDVNEENLAAALDLSGEEVREAVDYLENREDVVRFPHMLEARPRVELRPGRGWSELRDEFLGEQAGG